MVRVECFLAGLASRSEELVRASRDYDRGRTDADALNNSFQKDAARLANLQLGLGYSAISDGQLRWQDSIRPFSESVSGLEIGADLSRWFDTNTFYKRPTIRKELSTDGSFLLQSKYSENEAAFEEPSKKKSRAIALPGPYTLANLSDNEFYDSKEELIHKFGKVLNSVISRLSEKGYGRIQLNEPSLVSRLGTSALSDTKGLDAFESTIEELNAKSELVLHTYFGDCSKILDRLVKLSNFSAIGIDFTQTSLDSIASRDFDGKILGCACVDSRSSFVEPPDWIADFARQAVKSFKPSGLLLLPSSDLKYLPRPYCDEKIRAIGEAGAILAKEN